MSETQTMGAELEAIDAMGTIGAADVTADAIRAAFLAGFAAVRAGRKAPRVQRGASRPEAPMRRTTRFS
jgi:hypothetical protein